MNIPITLPRGADLVGMGSRLLAATWILLILPLLAVLAAAALAHAAEGSVLVRRRRFRGDGSPVDMLGFRVAPDGRISRSGADRVAELINVARGDISLFGRRPLPPGHPGFAAIRGERAGLIDLKALRV